MKSSAPGYDARQWFYAQNGQQRGPIPTAKLRSAFSAGQLPAETQVWCEGMNGWQPAHQVAGLLPARGATGPSHPPGAPPVPGAAQPAAAATSPTGERQLAHLGQRVSVLAMTIFGACLSIVIGGCTSSISNRVAVAGEGINAVQSAITAAVPDAAVKQLRVDTERVRSFGDNHTLLGFLEALLAIGGGVLAFVYLGGQDRLTLGDFRISLGRLGGLLILLAGLLTYTNIVTFLTAGVLFGLSAALCLLSQPARSGMPGR